MEEYWQRLRHKMGHDQLIIPSAAGAMIKDDKILLAFHKGLQTWQIPGGVQDINESIEQTVIREYEEEFNMRVKIKELISIYSSPKWIQQLPNGDIIQTLLFFFLLEERNEQSQIIINQDEIEKINFFKLNELPDNMMECCRHKCGDLLSYNGKVLLR